MEPPLAQILVVVANIRMRSWKTEVEEGFVSTAVEHELASPKLYGKPDSLLVVCYLETLRHEHNKERKGIRLQFRSLLSIRLHSGVSLFN